MSKNLAEGMMEEDLRLGVDLQSSVIDQAHTTTRLAAMATLPGGLEEMVLLVHGSWVYS